MKKRLHIRYVWIPLLAMGLMSGVPFGLAQPEMPQMEPLAFLKDALQTAGASALTSVQESDIQALITEFRNSHQKPVQNIAVENARVAYENAILSGDNSAAASQAAVLGNAQASEMVQRETDAAVFAINVIAILKTGSGQVDALVAQMGTSGFIRLIQGLAGGPRGFGPSGGGRGPRGPAGL